MNESANRDLITQYHSGLLSKCINTRLLKPRYALMKIFECARLLLGFVESKVRVKYGYELLNCAWLYALHSATANRATITRRRIAGTKIQ